MALGSAHAFAAVSASGSLFEGPHQLDDAERAGLAESGIAVADGPCLGFAAKGEQMEISLPGGPLRFDSVYPALGSDARTELASAIGARLTEEGCLVVDRHQRTNVEGVYAAGDAVIGLDQISQAMGQAGVAATTIRNDLATLAPLRR